MVVYRKSGFIEIPIEGQLNRGVPADFSPIPPGSSALREWLCVVRIEKLDEEFAFASIAIGSAEIPTILNGKSPPGRIAARNQLSGRFMTVLPSDSD